MATPMMPMQPSPGHPQRPPPRHLFSLTSQDPPSLTSQRSVKPVTLVVYTMKEGELVQGQFQMGRFTTAEQVQQRVMEALGISQERANVFSIWLTSKHLQLQLKHYHLPCKIFKRWKDLLSQYTSASYEEVCADEPILSLRRNAFFPLKEERKLLDPRADNRKAIDLLYHEAVFNVTKSRYPIPVEDLHTLAGLQASVYAAEFDHSADPASLRPFLGRFYPQYKTGVDPKKAIGRIFKQKSQTGVSSLEQSFTLALEAAQTKTTDPHQLKVLYLQLCWSKPYYGSVLFYGQIERPFNPVHILAYSDKKVTVAINAECLHIFSVSTPPEIMLFLTYDQLSWEFEPASDEGEDFYSTLWLEFDSVIRAGGEEKKVSKRVQVFSRQAPMMDAMISRCVSDIEKQELELRRKRVEQGGEEVLPEVCIKTHKEGESPRTQRQAKNFKENKLNCSVWTEEGQPVTGGFTLSRALRRRGKQQPGQEAVVSPQGQPEGMTPEGQPLQPLGAGRQRSTTESSVESRESLTGL